MSRCRGCNVILSKLELYLLKKDLEEEDLCVECVEASNWDTDDDTIEDSEDN